MTLSKPFWFDYEISWRNLHWIEQFLSAKYYHGRNPEIDVPDGKLIFYRDGTVRLINKTFEA